MTLIRKSPLQSHRSALKAGEKKLRKPMKRSRPKMTPIRKSAQGETCTIGLPGVCNGDPATVVLCHENSYQAGKGMGLKARDTEAAYGCNCCHDVYDGRTPCPPWLTRERVEEFFQRGKLRTYEKLIEKGLV